MNGKGTISTIQLFKRYPDEESARIYLEGRLWPNGAKCPTCGNTDRVTPRDNGFYRCNPCRLDFTVRHGTVFHRSHVPLNKWLYAMYLLVTAREGVSSLQLSKEIGITQKSAWFVLQRLREACGSDLTMLGNIVDGETRVGKEDIKNKKLSAGRGSVNRRAVIGVRERGRTKAKKAASTDADTIHGASAGGRISYRPLTAQ